MEQSKFNKIRQRALEILGKANFDEMSSESMDSMLAEHSVLHAELDVQNQELQETNLLLQHRLLEIETLFDSSPTAFCVLGLDKRIIRWNKTFEGIVTLYSDMSNKTFTSAYVAKGFTNTIFNWLMDEHDFSIDIQFQKKPEIWHRLTKNDFHSGQILLSIEDITDFKVIEFQKKNQFEVIQNQLDLKAELLANMSHEIKTPLTSVMGFLELLLDEELTASALNKVNRAKNASEGLLTTLNEILDMSKLNAGHINLKPQDIYLKELINECLELNQTKRVTDNKLQLNCEFDVGVPQFISVDPVKLKQIINNLINNAIKFTEHGHITIHVLSQLIEQRQMIEFNILDTGIGLANVDTSKLFEEYKQLDKASHFDYSESESGSGLGLAICKKLANAMGGNIGAENRAEQGSRFWFRIPYIPALPSVGNMQLVKSDKYEGEPIPVFKILVVEDNRSNQMIIKAMLKKLGQQITCVANGQEAVSAYRDNDFDFIIMDTHMPIMGGEEATNEIRKLIQESNKKQIPIISWSADARLENREHILNMGMNGILAKPIIPDELRELLYSIKQDGQFFPKS